MSRSIHKTVKGVFGGKSKSEINEMIEDDDEDVLDLTKKHDYKKREREQRAQQKLSPEPDVAVDAGR